MDTSRNHWDSCLEAGRMAYEKGCYTEADRILTEVMEKFATNYRQVDLAFVDLLMTYARVKREINQFNDALSLYYLALSKLRTKEKSDRILIVRVLQEIALCYCLQGKFHQAREKERRALSILDEHFGPDSQDADDCVTHLSCLSWIMGDMDSCSVYLQRHWQHCRKYQELKGKAMVAPAALLAHAHYAVGNYAQAERLFRQAMTSVEELEGLTKELSILGNELGLSICAQGRFEEARAVCQKSAALRENSSKLDDAPEKIDKIGTINNLADAYCAKNDFRSARQLCESADSLRWDAPRGNVAACLGLYSRLLKQLGLMPVTQRIDRRARELAQSA